MPVILAIAGLAVAGWRAPRESPPRFVIRSVATTASAPGAPGASRASIAGSAADAQGRAVDLPATVPSAHASTLAECHDGDLLAAWFAGTREGARDVAIHLSLIHI